MHTDPYWRQKGDGKQANRTGRLYSNKGHSKNEKDEAHQNMKGKEKKRKRKEIKERQQDDVTRSLWRLSREDGIHCETR